MRHAWTHSVRLGFLLCVIGLASVAAGIKIVPGRAFDRIINIWLENQDFDAVSRDPSVIDLQRYGILLTRFFAATHPSQPNYLAVVGGDYFGLDHDGHVRLPHNVSTIVDLLDTRRISWAGYFEDLPGPGFMGMGSDGSTGNGGWDYVRKHNPFVSYNSINHNGTRLLNLLSLDDFRRALSARQVPQFVFISPNMMHDGHNTTLATATSWTRDFVLPLLADGAFPPDERTLVVVSYDESATYGRPNRIATLLLGSAVPPALRGRRDDVFYTHYSVLATVQNNWGLPHLGRHDVGANVFAFVAERTGYAGNRDPPNADAADASVSYPGYLNSDPAKVRPLPAPNKKLVGAGGMPILDLVRSNWIHHDEDTPYDGSGSVYDGDKNLPVYKPPAANTI